MAYLEVKCMVTSLLLKLGYDPKENRADCTRRCGNISVPFPFGLEKGCFAREEFHLVCTNATSSAVLKLGDLQVNDVNVQQGIVNYTQQQNYGTYSFNGHQRDLFVDYGYGSVSSMQWVAANLSCVIAKQNISGYACVSINSNCVEVNTFSGYVGYRCNCSYGFKGNPYIQNGCQGT